MRKHIGFCLLWLCMSTQAPAQDPLDQLLKSLEGIAWPVDDAVLSRLGEAHDYKMRVEAVTEILDERETLYSRSDINDFQKTQIVCNALHLLDEYDLPYVERIINRLSEEKNWKRKERALLAYICVKRDIHYDTNVTYLLESLTIYETDMENPVNREVAWTVRDICDTLSYLGDLFIQKGDAGILEALFAYESIAFGYPAEYFSDMLVRMLLKRPAIFISSLARSSNETIRDVTSGVVFGIRNDSARKSLDEVLQDRLDRVEGREKRVVARLTEGVEGLRQQWAREP